MLIRKRLMLNTATGKASSGNNKITVEYDFVSRPCVIYKGDCIWKYPGNGFNEEVFFDVGSGV